MQIFRFAAECFTSTCIMRTESTLFTEVLFHRTRALKRHTKDNVRPAFVKVLGKGQGQEYSGSV